MELAFYTCYFGGQYSYSRLIPPIPSTKYDCYYFTNDRAIYNELSNTLWKIVFMDVPVHLCTIKNTMESKLLRCCPHKFEELKHYKYLCWFDSKIKVYDDKVEDLIPQLIDDKFIVLSKHPYSDRFTSVWDEFHLCLGTDKYRAQKEQYEVYIKKQIIAGFSETINIHFCGTWNLKKNV